MLNKKPSFTENVNLMVNSAVNKSKFSLNFIKLLSKTHSTIKLNFPGIYLHKQSSN